MTTDLGSVPYQGYLRSDCVTLPEALKAAGYRTGLSGKWHVGGEYGMLHEDQWTPGDPGHPLPLQRGFDRHYGTLDGAGSYFNPHTLYEDGTPVQVGAEEDFYYTDAISEKAADMIRDFCAEDCPFFVYVAYTAPHWPLHARPEDVEKYRDTYRDGWDALRVRRHQRLIDEGLIHPSWKLSPRDADSVPWDDITHKEWEARRMAVYAAQVDRMDQGIGVILDQLDRQGVRDNTLVLFLSDNGGCAELLQESGWVRDYVPPARTGEPVIPGNDPTRMPGGEDTYMSYDLPWANASNTPFRLFKHWVHEGGIATPFIAAFPKRTGAPNRIVHEPAHFIDIMATCLDAAGTTVSEPEGESLLRVIHGDEWMRDRPIVWEHEGNCAVRSGRWKLVKKHPGEWELYDMATDRTELDDRAQSMPETVRELSDIYEKWAARCGVVPWDRLMQATV